MHKNPIQTDRVQAAILEIRGQKVLLDQEVAKIYGVQTKRINEAVRNNPDKFPAGYILPLTKDEWDALKSKFSTSKRGGKVKLPTALPETTLPSLSPQRWIEATQAIGITSKSGRFDAQTP